jgi:hypothetical protein
MAYHAWSYKMPLSAFLEQVTFFCCGDDLVWSDKTGIFVPSLLGRTYASAGMFLEFSSLTPTFDLSFCGTKNVVTQCHGVDVIAYVYRWSKLGGSVAFDRKGCTPIDKFGKLCMITRLMFNDKPRYKIMCDLCNQFLQQSLLRSDLDIRDDRVAGLLSAITPWRLDRDYFLFES